MRRLFWPVVLLAVLVWVCLVPLVELWRELLERLIAPLCGQRGRASLAFAFSGLLLLASYVIVKGA